jgi:hypothetical protein
MKSYWLQFGTGNPASFTGLTPTLTVFSANGLTAITAPSITEAPASSGLYKFVYGPTLPVLFVADGGATLAASVRYLAGVLDPIDAVNEQADAIGSTLLGVGSTLGAMGSTLSGMGSTLGAMGATLSGMGATLLGMGATLGGMGETLLIVASSIGSVSDSFGSTSVDPTTLFGYMKRALEFWEGDSVYTKATGVWQLFSRGSSAMLRQKTLTNTSTNATKS